MMKKALYTLALAAALTVGCKSSSTDSPNYKGTPISLRIGGMGVEAGNETSDMAPATRAAGGPAQIMVSVADFGTSQLALYGVSDAIGMQDWKTSARVINALGATVSSDGSMVFAPVGEKVFFPESGLLSVYSIYPSAQVDGSPVTLNDDGENPVDVSITVDPSYEKQFDILHAKAESVTAVHAQSIEMPFDHVMSQLRFKVYREDEVTGHLSKITVRGISKATMNIKDKTITPSTDPADCVDFIAYNGTPIEITATATRIGNSPLFLVPGIGSVSTITLTVDGQQYTTEIPSTWNLAQGKVNTITLVLRKFGVRLEGEWSVSAWGDGDDHSGNLENNGKVISVSAKMLTGNKTTDLAAAPTFADVEIDGGYTHKGIPVKVVSGVFTTDKFNSGIIHDEPLSLTALKLYTGSVYSSASVVFDGRLANGVTADKVSKIIIDTLNNGRLKIKSGTSDIDYDINMLFGGFGAGTEFIPYEVSGPMTLANVAKFPGSKGSTSFDGKAGVGAHFAQVTDIDMGAVTSFKPITFNAGIYDGNGYVIKNLNITSSASTVGLFGAVQSPSSAITVLRSIVIESGTITYTGGTSSNGVGAIAGTMDRGRIEKCINKAKVIGGLGTPVGGIVGRLSSPLVQVSGCANFGEVSGRISVGGVIGEGPAGSEIFDCYNAGSVVQTATASTQNFGGILGKLNLTTSGTNIFRNCYNIGSITTTINTNYTGSIIGFIVGAYSVPVQFKNLFYLTLPGVATYPPIGTDPTTGNSATLRCEAKTSTQLQEISLISILNDGRNEGIVVWRGDKSPSINSGYPIFVWQ